VLIVVFHSDPSVIYSCRSPSTVSEHWRD